MKSLLSYSLLAAAIAVGVATAENTATTTPVGYVTLNFPGDNSLTAISVTLNKSKEFSGVATAVAAGSLTKADAGWTADQWVGKLVSVSTAAGAEESFLVTASTADTLTVAAPFDLTTRYSNTASFSILTPHTVGSIFGSSPSDVKFTQNTNTNIADLLYLWNGVSYVIYHHNGTTWRKSGSLNSANNDVVYPDEGMFVLRRAATPVDIVVSGEVPAKAQTTTIPGNAQTTVASRFPVGTTIGNMGFQSIPGWAVGSATTGDRVFVWTGSSYTTYWYNGTNWRRSGSLTNVDNDVLPANSFMFVVRTSTGNGQAAVHSLPYSL